MTKKLIILFLAICCQSLSAQVIGPGQGVGLLSLQQLKDSALHHNMAIRSAQYRIDAAQEQRKEAFTKYFPNVSGTGVWFNANKGMAQTSFMRIVIPYHKQICTILQEGKQKNLCDWNEDCKTERLVVK